MKLCWILFSAAILLIGIYVPCEGFLDRTRFQDFVDKYVDVEKFKEEGFKSLNSTAIKYIWNYFKTKFIRHYSSTGEEKERLKIFRAHLKQVLESNIIKKPTFQLGLNEYADWTIEEFKTKKTGLIRSEPHPSERTFKQRYQKSARRNLRRLKRNLHRKRDDDELPDQIDWREQGVVSSIKNQGNCGSCYAFATAAVMESAYAINSNSENVIDFSPQQIVDCSSDGNYGCLGGNFEPTFNYLKQQGDKIATEDSYPYVGTKETCTTDGVDQIDLEQLNATLIESGDETALAEALVNYGPMYIAINANYEFVMFYRNGIVTTDDCPPDQLNHAVTLVGYGYDDIIQMSYWLIKNSWGTGWGENGYFRIAKDAGNMCGVASEGWYVTLE